MELISQGLDSLNRGHRCDFNVCVINVHGVSVGVLILRFGLVSVRVQLGGTTKRLAIDPREDTCQRMSIPAYLCSLCVFGNLLRDFYMLAILGSDILLITGNVIFCRNQAEKSLKRGIVPLERFQQLCGRDHPALTAELKKER